MNKDNLTPLPGASFETDPEYRGGANEPDVTPPTTTIPTVKPPTWRGEDFRADTNPSLNREQHYAALDAYNTRVEDDPYIVKNPQQKKIGLPLLAVGTIVALILLSK